jgi:hypothetical protein
MTVRCHVESPGPVLVVRLDGELRLSGAYPVWRTLVKLLVDQPDVLVLDLTTTVVAEPRSLLVLGAVARRASLWPGVPVIVAVPDEAVRGQLSRTGIDRQLAVCADRDEATLLADGAPAPPRLRERLDPQPGAARRARDVTTEACLSWDLPDVLLPACIIASELVTNAVRHTGMSCELSLARTMGHLHIAVHDQSSEPAVLRDAGPAALTGRGLLIVARSALRWGSTLADHGKVVWAMLPAR